MMKDIFPPGRASTCPRASPETAGLIAVTYSRPFGLLTLLLAFTVRLLAEVDGAHSPETPASEPLTDAVLFAPISLNVGPAAEAVSMESSASISAPELSEALRLIEAGKLDESILRAKDFLKREPLSAPAEEILGSALVIKGQIDDGLVHLNRAIELNPNQATAITKVGDVFLARGDKLGAKQRYQLAVAASPADRHPHQRLGELLEQEGRYDQAIQEYETGLVGTAPAYVGIKVNLGRLYNRHGQFAKTIALLAPVVAADSPNGTAHLVLGTAWLFSGSPAKAVESFEHGRTVNPSNEANFLALGIAYRQSGDAPRSAIELKQALAIKPDWADAEYQMAETLAALHHAPEAFSYYHKAAGHDPARRAVIENRIAHLLIYEGRANEALKIYQTLRADGVANPSTYLAWAKQLQDSGSLAEAGSLLREADQTFPNHGEVKFQLGMHLALVRDYAAALIILRRASELRPEDPRIHKAISLAELRNDNVIAAISEARLLVKRVPTSSDDEFYLATLLEQSGGTLESEKLYQAVLGHAPDHVGALNNLAVLRLAQHRLSDALPLAQRAAALAPDNVMVLDTLAWTYYQMGNLADAAKLLERVVTAPTSNSGHRYHLASVYAKQGHASKALELLDAALTAETPFTERFAAKRLEQQLRKS